MDDVPQPNDLTGEPLNPESIANQLAHGSWAQGSPPGGLDPGSTGWWNEAVPPPQPSSDPGPSAAAPDPSTSSIVNALSPSVAAQLGMGQPSPPSPFAGLPPEMAQGVNAQLQALNQFQHPVRGSLADSPSPEYRNASPGYLQGVNAQLQGLRTLGLRNTPPDFT